MLSTKKIIIDTDPGVDDAIAIFMALQSPYFEILGLTTVYGNGHTDLTTQNALRILEFLNAGHIPVASGATHPLKEPLLGVGDFVHGMDGLGNTHLPAPKNQAIAQSATDFTIDMIKKYPHEVTLIEIAPLTNLALLLERAPEIVPLIKEVVIMGGVINASGNVSDTAEANIWNDAFAAEKVFQANWLITLFGLNVTRQARLEDDYLRQLPSRAGRLGQHIVDISKFYRNFYKTRWLMDAVVVHDACPLAYLIQPELFTFETGQIQVTTQGDNKGQTVLLPIKNNNPRHKVAVGINQAGFLNLLDRHLTKTITD